MIVGTVVLVIWKQIGLGAYMYEIVPGFIGNVGTILIVNIFLGEEQEDMDKEFYEVSNIVNN